MPTKACLRGQVFTAPEGSTVEFAPGTLINLWHDVYNCGNETGYIYAWIKEDETIIATDRQWCNPQTEFYSCALAIKYGWVMPNKTVKIHMIAKHAGPPDYAVIQDYDKIWTLKPSIVTCGQPVKVTDEYGNPIPYAIVYAYQNGTIKDDIRVGSDGRGSLTLNTGESYRLKAFKADYECYVCEKTITACTSEIVLSLRKVPTKCTQDFKVVDYDTGAGIGGANVNVAGVTLVTYADGTCSKPELTVGNSYTAVASKSGYECVDCSKSFTACEDTIILTLKLPAPPPECEYTGHAINAKIDHWDVPDNATEGETVTGWVKVDGDCYTPGQTTRGRVKFTVNGGTPVYSTVFTFDCFGETPEMPFSFVMPDYDVTLTAEVERCNENGEWENAGPKYKKEFPVSLRIAVCEYTGHAINAKIDHWDVPDNATEGETVTGWVKVDGDCYTPGQTTRGRVKFTVNGGTPVYSTVFTFDCFGETPEMPFSFVMPEYDVTLTAEIERCNAEGNWENAGPKYKKEFPISLRIAVCEYTGYASDGKFEKGKWVYPERALKNTPVNIKIISDSIEVKLGSTRYKVVVTEEWSSEETDMPAFLLGYIGEHEDTYSFTMPEQDASLTAKLYRCNADGQWELCPHTDATHTITITEGAPEFNWICWTLIGALVPNLTKAVIEGRATIQAGGIGCLTAHRVDGIVSITIKNLTSGKEMTQNTDAEGYLEFEFPFADCVDGVNEFQLVSGEVSSEKKSVDTREEIAIGKIIACQTEVPEGDYGVLGWDLKVPVRIQNQGGATGEFRVYFMNITTGKKEDVDPPDLPFPIGWWDNIKSDKTKEYTLESSSVLTEGMELEMQLWQQEKWEVGGEPDDVVKITVIEEVKPPVEIPKKLILYGVATIGCYAVGSMLPEKYGKPVKVISIIPGILTGVEGYKLIKEKIPAWLK